MNRVLAVGLDGFAPPIAEPLLAAGELPNLARLREVGGYARIRTTAPAQTPVAWSSVAVGTNPGGHGIYDFLTRDPRTYRPEIALHGYERTNSFLPPKAVNRRGGAALWAVASEAGVPATVIRHPCTYPPERVYGRMLAGVGVTDLRGGFGTSTVYTTEPDLRPGEGERILPLQEGRDGMLRAHLVGPLRPDGEDARLELGVQRGDDGGVRILLAGQEAVPALEPGQWSPWISVRFKMGALQSVRGQVRWLLVRTRPHVLLYASPVNFDPAAPPFPISHPWDYAKELEDALGPYHTLGMAEDHGGLNNGRFTEEEFLAQCDDVLDERLAMLRYEMERFQEGLLFCVFDTPDRMQHMFWRFLEPDHPANEAHGFDAEFKDVIREHYQACDRIVGEVMDAVDDDTLLVVLSDHGFGTFRREVHLNRWLHEQGLLVLKAGVGPGADAGEMLRAVDWDRTRAYAVGLAGIYLNLRGRESRGIVDPDEAPALRRALAEQLTGLRDRDTGREAIRSAASRDDLYRGPHLDTAPDVVVGCATGYRVSAATALGAVPTASFEDNGRRWSGDHVMDPALVPGVLFMNRPFDESSPHLTDVAPTLLDALGVPAAPAMEGRSLLP